MALYPSVLFPSLYYAAQYCFTAILPAVTYAVFQDNVDVFINAGGVLNNWKWPNIEGIHSFKGKLIHSARWDQKYDFTGKKVASISIGSSAPGINEPTANDPDIDTDYNFTPESIAVSKNPEVLRQYRAAIIDRRTKSFQRALADSDVPKRAQELFRKSMTERLGNSEKGRKAAQYLLPDFPIGYRRQTPGPGYLEALTQDNVDMWWDDIARITEKGILTRSGEEKEYNIIICATGFDTLFKPLFPLIGRNKVNLASK
ncbi:hypothetical protein AFGD_006827 [Aspergillus flavus]|nr:hypothetical protein AFGD_006827 [Aspergillus flavus]